MSSLQTNAISTLCATLVTRYLKLDTIFYGPVYGAIESILSFFSTYDFSFSIEKNYLILAGIILLFFLLIFGIIYLYQKILGGGKKIVLQHRDSINEYITYLSNQDRKCYPLSDYEYVGCFETAPRREGEIISLKTTGKGFEGKKYYFNDPFFGKGYYIRRVYREKIEEKEKVTKISEIYYEIFLKKKISQKEFIDTIREFNKKKSEENSYVKIAYIKLINEKSHASNAISRSVDSIENLEKEYLGNFFSSNKERLWVHFKRVALNPESYTKKGQNATAQYLFYGPGGTGKSSFASRVSQILGKHLFSLNILKFNKEALYNLFLSGLAPMHIGHYRTIRPIILLEEFDITIKELLRREEERKERQHIILKSIEDDKKVNVKPEIEQDNFTIRDLLELLQGTAPNNGAIVIATTNKFEELKNICSELFRVGRLTPVYFGYPEDFIIQEMSKFYFGKSLEFELPKIANIPHCEIVDLAFQYENDFEGFSNELQKIFSQKQNSQNLLSDFESLEN